MQYLCTKYILCYEYVSGKNEFSNIKWGEYPILSLFILIIRLFLDYDIDVYDNCVMRCYKFKISVQCWDFTLSTVASLSLPSIMMTGYLPHDFF